MMRTLVALCGLAGLALAACSRAPLEVPDIVDAGVDAELELPPLCIEVPPDSGPLRADLTLPVQLSQVDLMFLIDASGSMADEIDNVRSRVRNFVVPRVRESITGSAFGLAFFGEFPVAPHGNLGSPKAYELRLPITNDAQRLEAALDLVPDWSNADFPEAQVEGLYQVATGEGLPPFIEPSFGCATGGEGGACFRSTALPVVMLITDAPFHNGPPGIAPIDNYNFTPAPHTYAETIAALRAHKIVVIGLGASDSLGPSPLPHLTALARDTGAVDAEGRALVFDIGGRGNNIGNTIVTAVEGLAAGLPLDVDAYAVDVPGDAVDARTLITSVSPLAAEPASGVEQITETTFVGTQPGTRVTFQIELDISTLPPTPETQRIPATVVFRAAQRSIVGEREILILIPGTDGASCANEFQSRMAR